RIEPSAAFLLAARRLVARPGLSTASALVVADPRTDGADATDLPPLPGAVAEANRVSRSYGAAVTLEGAAARRSLVLRELPKHAVFHFAGHAVFDQDAPERSYLALAGDGTDNSGHLQAREIANLRLSNTQIVVLSACRTLGGHTSRTGAVSGLAA